MFQKLQKLQILAYNLYIHEQMSQNSGQNIYKKQKNDGSMDGYIIGWWWNI